jgi:hypothetical protein
MPEPQIKAAAKCKAICPHFLVPGSGAENPTESNGEHARVLK